MRGARFWFWLWMLAIATPILIASRQAPTVRTVKAGEDLQAVLNAAQPGDTIELPAGASFTGNFVLPKKAYGEAITLRTAGVLPDRRITPEDAAKLATLIPVGVEPAIRCDGCTGWALDGLRFESNPLGYYDLIALNDATLVILDRILLVAGPNGQKRAIRGNGKHITLTRSHLANVWAAGQDSQAFCAWNGPGPYTLTDNYLEAAGENVMFGGAASSKVENIPADIRVEGNHFSKRLEWKGNHPSAVKNLFELKAAKRAVIKGNLFERNWTDAQNGYAILFTVRNDDGNCTGCDQFAGAPWTVVEDVTFEGNVIRDVEHAFNLLGYDSYGASGRTTRIAVKNNKVSTAGNFVQMGGELGTVLIDHNTVDNGGKFVFLYAGGVWPAGIASGREAAFAAEDFTVTNNLAPHNSDGLFGDGTGSGTPVLEKFASRWVWTHNVLAGDNNIPYPPITWKPPVSAYRAQFATDLTLLPGSSYATLDTNNGALGATVVLPGGIAYQPPPVTPPPPTNPCEADPFRPMVSKWPSSQMRSASGTWNPNGKRVKSAQFLWDPQRFVAEDYRGCTHAVVR